MAAEKQFENKVKRWLHSIGVYVGGTPSDKMNVTPVGWFVKLWGGGYQKSGIPDLLLCINGVFLSAEIKASNGTPSELQKMNTARINGSNGIGLILYPEGFEEFKNIVKGVIHCNAHIAELKRLTAANSSTKCDMLTKY